MKVHISATTVSGAQYIFTLEGDVITCDRWEGEITPSIEADYGRPIGRMTWVLKRLPNIQMDRCLLLELPDEGRVVSSRVTSMTAIGSY